MLDEKGNAMTTTTWQDNHSGYRRHELMTKELGAKIPRIGANEDVNDFDDVLAIAKLFSPYTGWRWFITEWDPESGLCFGLVQGFEAEVGYFDLTELAETTVFGNVPAVERDLYWEPKTIGEIRRGSRSQSRHSKKLTSAAREGTKNQGKGDIMPNENDTEASRRDALNAYESLFGDAESGADDAVAKEQDAKTGTGEEQQLGSEVAEEQAGAGQEGADESDQDPRESDIPEKQADEDQAGEKEAAFPEELKVVVSLKEGRATVGVQQPSSDPHIESFDDPDLCGLVREVPAVIERARAKWEGEPKYPAHERPATSIRRRPRRGQGPAQATAAEGGADQQQPEALRLF